MTYRSGKLVEGGEAGGEALLHVLLWAGEDQKEGVRMLGVVYWRYTSWEGKFWGFAVLPYHQGKENYYLKK